MRAQSVLRTLLVAVALVAPVVLAVAGRDAGTDTDAGDTPETATPLAYGAYQGSLNDKDDHDWYAFPATADPRCVATEATGEADGDVEIRLKGGANDVVLPGDLNEAPVFASALVVNDVTDLRFGVKPSWQGARLGTYDFAVQALRHADLGAGDGASGGDASGSMPVAAKHCTAGTLALANNDLRDVYEWTGAAGQYVVFSFALLGTDAVAYLDVVAPSGELVGRLAGGDLTALALPEDGTYRLLVVDESIVGMPTTGPVTMSMNGGVLDAVDYLFGVDPDPTQGCRPSCFPA